jgi:ankyrin repeat protein
MLVRLTRVGSPSRSRLVSRTNRSRSTSAPFATIERRDTAALKGLLEGGLDPNTRDATGRTLLMEAASRDADDVIRLLLAFGAAVNAATVEGWTPLMSAAAALSDKGVRVLLDAGANPEARTVHGLNAFDIAHEQLWRRLQFRIPFTQRYVILTVPPWRRDHRVLGALREASARHAPSRGSHPPSRR